MPPSHTSPPPTPVREQCSLTLFGLHLDLNLATPLTVILTTGWKNVHYTTLRQFFLCRPWPICYLGTDLFWRIVMYTSRHDLMFTNKDRMFCQSRSQAVTVRLYSERRVCQKFDNWYSLKSVELTFVIFNYNFCSID